MEETPPSVLRKRLERKNAALEKLEAEFQEHLEFTTCERQFYFIEKVSSWFWFPGELGLSLTWIRLQCREPWSVENLKVTYCAIKYGSNLGSIHLRFFYTCWFSMLQGMETIETQNDQLRKEVRSTFTNFNRVLELVQSKFEEKNDFFMELRNNTPADVTNW